MVVHDGEAIHVWRIVFKSGEVLVNRDCAINGNFLVVACMDNEDRSPTWYPISMIECLQGVEVYHRHELDRKGRDIINHSLFPELTSRWRSCENGFLHYE